MTVMIKTFTTQLEDNGETIEIVLDSNFLEFYKKETGHTNVTKKGVTRFLNSLIKFYQRNITDSCC